MRRLPRPSGPALRLLPILWLLALLLIPAIGWIMGERQPLLDNRPKTTWPHLTPDALRHGATYRQLDAAFFERLPPRARAIEAHTKISMDLFHDSPNPDVAIGSDGYLYYKPGVDTCTTRIPPDDPADAAEVLVRVLQAGGRRALVVEPADKLFVHPQDAPRFDEKAQTCARTLQASVTARLAATPGGLDMDTPLRRLEAQGQPTFLRNDTHWNWRGRLVYVKAVLDFLRPGLADAVGLHAGPAIRQLGDTAAMVGLSRADDDRAIVATRTPNPPVAPGRAVVLGDSQTERAFLDPPPGLPGARPLAAVALPGTAFCNWSMMLAGQCDAAIAGARDVVVESVGRNLADFDGTCWRPTTLVAEGLTGPAGAYQRVDGVTPVSGRTLTVGRAGRAQFRVVPTGGDVSRIPRLLKMTLRDLPAGTTAVLSQQPQDGKPAPCATPQQTSDRTSLILPVPADRRASDLIVTLTAPAGTELIAPREIALDGRPGQRLRAARG